jgi:UDP-4-amino-4,6-dideoxy-N-acetyl-beta-L-altrosamine transaminase
MLIQLLKPMKPIPYGKQDITQEDIDAVAAVLRSDFLTQGPLVKEFEERFARYVGSNYAVAVSNGTAALHLCALALAVRPGDKVITTPITFAASANCVRYCGGDVVFSDIDPDSLLLDINCVRNLLEKSSPGTFKGIIPVDFAGRAVNMEEFRKVADEYGLWIIEDACHAPGGYFYDSSGKKQFCGNGQFADLAIFSFHPVKHIATGEGGMVCTNNKHLYEKLLMLRTHGITREPSMFENGLLFASAMESERGQYPGWYMEMQTLGYNYRITDFQCALGISQLQRAHNGLKRRLEIAKRYDEAFAGHSFIKSHLSELTGIPSGHAYHLYIIQVPERLKLYNFLRSVNIFTQVHYIPTHLMPYYRNLGWREGDLPKAENYYSKCLSLPMFPTLQEEEQDYVIEKIKSFYE